MIGQIKTYALAGLALAATIFYALFRTEQAKRAKEKVQGLQKARETENKANDAMINGLQKEQEVSRETIDTTKRDHFSK